MGAPPVYDNPKVRLLIILLVAVVGVYGWSVLIEQDESVGFAFVGATAILIFCLVFGVSEISGWGAKWFNWASFLMGAVSLVAGSARVYVQHGYTCTGEPGNFDSLYLSIVTFTTLGYGECLPSEKTRLFAAYEALSGMIIMGLFIAMLVAHARRRTPNVK